MRHISHTLSPSLSAQSHLLEECDEAWLRAQSVEHRADFQVNDQRAPLVGGLFEPVDRLGFFVESDVDQCEVEARNILLTGNFLQTLQGISRPVRLTAQRVGVSENRQASLGFGGARGVP